MTEQHIDNPLTDFTIIVSDTPCSYRLARKGGGTGDLVLQGAYQIRTPTSISLEWWDIPTVYLPDDA